MLLAVVLFLLGLCGVLVRRNIVFILLSVEVMLNAAGLAFVAAGWRWAQADGQVMFLFILTMAAAEVAVASGAGAPNVSPVQDAGRRCVRKCDEKQLEPQRAQKTQREEKQSESVRMIMWRG